MMDALYPGTRVLVFDSRLFRDDRTTPLSRTMQPATVLRWYGRVEPAIGQPGVWRYPNLIDVKFDHDGRESRGHFAERLQVIP